MQCVLVLSFLPNQFAALQAQGIIAGLRLFHRIHVGEKSENAKSRKRPQYERFRLELKAPAKRGGGVIVYTGAFTRNSPTTTS